MSPSTQPISHSAPEFRRSKMLEMQAYLNEICETHGIVPPFLLDPLDIMQNLPGNLGDIPAVFGGPQDPLPGVDTDTNRLSALSIPLLPQHTEAYSRELSQLNPFPFFSEPLLERSVAKRTQELPDGAPSERGDLTNGSHSSSLIHHTNDTSQIYNKSTKYISSTAPSRRRSLSRDRLSPAPGPYPAPSVHPFSQRHSRDCTTPAPKISVPEKNYSDRHNLPGITLAGQMQESSSLREGHRIPQEIRLRNGRRIRVPLKEWRPKRAPKRLDDFGFLEFWTIEHATGTKLRGTYLADRFRDDTGRSFLSDGLRPFPSKREKGFNLRILWPGYPEFSKKISIHRPLSECTLRDVRDWVFSALAEFIRVPGPLQGQENGFWRVGGDEVVDVVHLDDIVLVRLKQAGKGTWVPELDIVD